MKSKLIKRLIRIHFVALAVAIINSIFDNFTVYSLEGNIELIIEIFIAITGLILFFFHLKPFKKLNYYFSIYALTSFFLILGLIVRGFFWGLVLSIFLFPIIPDDKYFEENEIIIIRPYQGMLSMCCTYQVKERQAIFFEKDIGMLNLESPIDFETVDIDKSETEIIVFYSTDSDKGIVEKKIIKR